MKSDYAARAVLSLARHYHEASALKAEDIGAEHGVPSKYLVQILLELKSKQIVKSVRGKEGGYLLAKPPGEITLGEILRAMHGDVFDSPALSDPRCPAELRNAWKKLQNALDQTSNAINFQQLMEEGSKKEEMYYI